MLHHLQLYVYVNRGTDKITATGTDMKMNIDVDLYRYLQKDQVSGSEIRLYFTLPNNGRQSNIANGLFCAQHHAAK